MPLYRHPHLVRGIVHTPHGAFVIVRGLADLPEEVGDSLGWPRFGEGTSSPVLRAAPNSSLSRHADAN